MAKQEQDRRDEQELDEFYEAMPLTHDTPYQYRQEGWDDNAPDDNGKQVAIITLVLVAVVAIVVALLFVQALMMAQNALVPLAGR